MSIDKNDPRLTAYVLNELDAAERAAVEKAVKQSGELQKEIQLIREAVGLLALPQESEVHRLSAEQKEKLFPKKSKPFLALAGGLATAALALMLFNRGVHEQAKMAPMEKPAQLKMETSAADMKEKLAESESMGASGIIAATPAAPAASGGTGAPGAVMAKAKKSAEPMESSEVSQNLVAADSAAEMRSAKMAPSAMRAKPAADPVVELPQAPTFEVKMTSEHPVKSDMSIVGICFYRLLPREGHYNVKLLLSWTFEKRDQTLQNVSLVDPGSTGIIDDKLIECIRDRLNRMGFFEEPATQFEYTVEIKSK